MYNNWIGNFQKLMIYNNFFSNKKVLITGNTGFKGSWLSIWLDLLGAKIYGLSLDPPTSPSIFERANLNIIVENNIFDIQDSLKVTNLVKEIEPDYIFHLAAQPIVKEAYLRPVETWKTNVIGTINILESLRLLDKKCIGIIITSDKCYENKEWEWGYRENDLLGGSDPYSASKGAAELAFSSYYRSFFLKESNKINVCSARAGNVIGGGDWADNRIVPDCIKAWTKDKPVNIKSPKSTRPFQHVLEPLNGYITLAEKLNLNNKLSGESFNFGPPSNFNYQVIEVVKKLSRKWNNSSWLINEEQNTYNESKLLKLNCDKALSLLNWSPTLDFETTINMTNDWYYSFYNDQNLNVLEKCRQQIKYYMNIKKALN